MQVDEAGKTWTQSRHCVVEVIAMSLESIETRPDGRMLASCLSSNAARGVPKLTKSSGISQSKMLSAESIFYHCECSTWDIDTPPR